MLRMFMRVFMPMSMRTFHQWGGLVFIVDVLPVGW